MLNGKVVLGTDGITVEKVWEGKVVGSVEKWNSGAVTAHAANGKQEDFRGYSAEREAERFIWGELKGMDLALLG